MEDKGRSKLEGRGLDQRGYGLNKHRKQGQSRRAWTWEVPKEGKSNRPAHQLHEPQEALQFPARVPLRVSRKAPSKLFKTEEA